AAGIDVLLPCGPADGVDPPLIALGEKRSEEPYAADDLDLLMTIGCNVALRVQPSAAAEATFEECPECGRCHDAATRRCEQDATLLTVVRGGRLLAARYRLERRLGQGGMGIVYAAVDTALDRAIAVKLIREDLLGMPGAAERFRQEARAVASFTHPN